MKRTIGLALLSLITFAIADETAVPDNWQQITEEPELKAFMSGATLSREEGGEQIRGIYYEDGTGTLYAWGAEFPRSWSVVGKEIQVVLDKTTGSFTVEKHPSDPNLFRVVDTATGKPYEVRKENGVGIAAGSVAEGSKTGGPATASAEEVAAELANPNTAMASMNFKNQFKTYSGDLPNADDQFSYTLLFQPILPFPLKNKDKIIWRPALPLNIEQPVFNGTDFEGKSGLGDFAFDIAYAFDAPNGWLLALGAFTTLPTGTDASMTSGHWTLGPEFLLGKMWKKGLIGVLPNHVWDVAGWRDNEISMSTVSAFAIYLPGGGWNVGTAPIMSYDWVNDQAVIPINLSVGKTVVSGSGRPWKYSLEVNYYADQYDAIGAEWMIGINISPVTVNKLAGLFY